MSIATLGRVGFEDMFTPAKGKSEWGMDTLTRKMCGARSGLETFIAGLTQGDIYQGYFLQTWDPNDDPDVAVVTLEYKGLITGGTPKPKITTNIVSAVGRASKSYLDQNAGLGIILRTIVLWKFQYAVPLTIGDLDTVVGKREVYTQSATLEYSYHAVESRYRYISIGNLGGPRYSFVTTTYTPSIEKAIYSTSDGMKYGRDNASVVAALGISPQLREKVVSSVSEPVIGSPYYECEDIVRLELVDPSEVA